MTATTMTTPTGETRKVVVRVLKKLLTRARTASLSTSLLRNDGADDSVVDDERETDTIVVRDDKVEELSVRNNDGRCDEGVRCLDATYRHFEQDKPVTEGLDPAQHGNGKGSGEKDDGHLRRGTGRGGGRRGGSSLTETTSG